MKLVNDYGVIVRMTAKQYVAFLRAGAAGQQGLSAADFGRVVGTLDLTATDWDANDFKSMLNEYTGKGK